jgi:hypothetical protein
VPQKGEAGPAEPALPLKEEEEEEEAVGEEAAQPGQRSSASGCWQAVRVEGSEAAEGAQ